MNEWNINITAQAEADLRGIYEYISFTLLEPGVAEKLLNRIIAAINSLTQMPARYAVYEKEPMKSRGLRRMNVGNYAVFFTPVEEWNKVVILRVLYGGRNIDEILTKSTGDF